MIISKELRLRCWQVFTFAFPEIWVNASYRAASQIWNAHVPLSNMHWFNFFRNTFWAVPSANRFIMAIFVNTLARRSTKWKFTKWAIKGKNLERVWIYCKWPEEGIVRHAFCPPAVWVAIKSDMCHGNRDINNLTKLWK